MIELFTRAGAVGTYDRVVEAIERVRELEADDRGSECRVTTWDKQITLGNGHIEGRMAVLERIEEFETWARERSVSLYPFFEERTRSSLATDGEQRVIVLPVLCLAVYEGEGLRELFPCTANEVTYTVHDGLAALETNGTNESKPFDERKASRRSAERKD